MALGMMIGLARRICVEDRALRGGRWAQTTGSELWGKTLGIVGLGHIGKSIALLGCGMGMRVLATDTARDITFANEHGISYVPLAKLFQESDFVSLHCPLTPETRGLINTATLAQMKSTAYLINTARGPLVDESALAQALREQRIAGAGLDVFETEPPVNSPYLEFDNVILTSHRGGATQEAIESSLEIALLNVTQVLHGQQPIYRVN
jgi:D-3-phosphoglycerate dehydrogenase